ncbi:MAG: electron transfer flavoprotein subunit beta/FixA family protein [bacterium]|nr:electron transfer flavoprotein subunit beta/FixA family protein [bacterium]
MKQVPDTTEVKIHPETKTLIREGVPSIINPFDAYAIEEGIRIKERLEGKVTILSMGPPQVKEALKEAIAMGADDAILLSDRAFAGSDTLATSYTLAEGIRKIGEVDLIICGKQAIDGDTAQVGPGIAEQLDIPHITYVRKVAELGPGHIRVERMVEGGYEVVETTLPVLITVVKEINEPRLPSMKGLMRARRQEITVWTAADLNVDPDRIGLTGSPTEVIRVFTPEVRAGGEILSGEVAEQVDALVDRLLRAGVL